MQDATTSRSPASTRCAHTVAKVVAAALFLCVGTDLNLHGQQPPPDPRPFGAQALSSITGTVRDARGLPLVGTEARLLGQNNNIEAKQATDNNGVFTFTNIPPGIYQVRIVAAGRQPFASESLAVGAGTRHELPVVVMHMVSKTTIVNVNASPQEVSWVWFPITTRATSGTRLP